MQVTDTTGEQNAVLCSEGPGLLGFPRKLPHIVIGGRDQHVAQSP